jgi:hypothetical protein
MTDGSTSAPLDPTPPPVDRRFARSAALWLRAYPRRWRVERGGELTAVLADLAEPGARRVDVRSAAGLVRAGWATRWREHPPLLPYLAFRVLRRRPDPVWDPWLRDDVDGVLYPLRAGATSALWVWLGVVSGASLAGVLGHAQPAGGVAAMLALAAVVSVVAEAGGRGRTRDWLFPQPDPTPHFGPYIPLRPTAPAPRETR